MLVHEMEARLAELLGRYGREAQHDVGSGFEGVCQVFGSHNHIVIHVHYAARDDATPAQSCTCTVEGE